MPQRKKNRKKNNSNGGVILSDIRTLEKAIVIKSLGISTRQDQSVRATE